MMNFISFSLCFLILVPLLRFLHRVWWKPTSIERKMRAQGVKGPSYKILYGNTKEMDKMVKEVTSSPMELSHDVLHRLQPQVYTWLKLYGKSYLNWYGTQPELIVMDPELIKDILNDKDGAFPRGDVPPFVKKLLGNGILTSKGDKWAKLRKIANHAFYTESLKHMIPAMTASVEAMLERWTKFEGKEIDAYEEFKIMTSEVISRTAFGSSYKDGAEMFKMWKKLANIISKNEYKVRLPLIGKLVKSQDDIEAEKLDKGILDKIRGMIKKREEKMMAGEECNEDFLGSLIKASHDPDVKKRVTEQEIIDECKTFYNSGQETTTTLLAWALLLLATHPEWQDKAREEVFQLFGKENPHTEGVARLKIGTMIVNETLRLYTPVLKVVRKVKYETRLGKLMVPPEMDLFIPSLALHHDPEIWGEDAHLFKPERFADGVAKATKGNPMAFVPFGYGPRFCVGMNFATTEAKIALAMVLQRYKFTLSPSYVHSPIKLLTVRPKYGLPVILHAL